MLKVRSKKVNSFITKLANWCISDNFDISSKQRVAGRKQKAESRKQRAEGRKQRAEGRE
tara:strand:+ start:35758 stop:35934 length:177 start_codon:yes stop_codon:yes gene_type:complete